MNESINQPVPASSLPLADQIVAHLSSGALWTAAELQAATGKSQASISLAISSLGSRVHRLGAARSTRYALAKSILGLDATQPLSFTDVAGAIHNFGSLTLLQGGQVSVRASDKSQWLSVPGKLPWFLKPLRPQGFLGRQHLQVRPDFPNDPDLWTVEQALYIAANHAGDPPGAFGLGAVAGQVIDEAPSSIAQRGAHYDILAESVGRTLPAGSSAGGEQPKFLGELAGEGEAHRHVIVKFSPPRGTPFGERWHQLLHLEHLAHQLLREHGAEAAETNIVESGKRTYLESQRFDRVGILGKRHVVAIDALHDEFVAAARRNWVVTCEALAEQKLITRDELSMAAKVFAFGQCIGNDDMHFGNLSFFVDDVVRPRLKLAPVYDMLPMMWRPNIHAGTLDATPVREQPVNTAFLEEYREARAWAIEFWTRAAELDALDNTLKNAATESAVRLKSLA
jgi:HipA-like C-terminal domain